MVAFCCWRTVQSHHRCPSGHLFIVARSLLLARLPVGNILHSFTFNSQQARYRALNDTSRFTVHFSVERQRCALQLAASIAPTGIFCLHPKHGAIHSLTWLFPSGDCFFLVCPNVYLQMDTGLWTIGRTAGCLPGLLAICASSQSDKLIKRKPP